MQKRSVLKPAIIYKDQICKEMNSRMYTHESFLYMGYHCGNIEEAYFNDDKQSWAIVDSKDNMVGYISYSISAGGRVVYNFGLYAFKNTPLIGYGVTEALDIILNNIKPYTIQFRMIDTNPVYPYYSALCKILGGEEHYFPCISEGYDYNMYGEYIFHIHSDSLIGSEYSDYIRPIDISRLCKDVCKLARSIKEERCIH